MQHQTIVEASDTNLVEIDLIRGYRGVTLAWKRSASVVLETPCHVCTRRARWRNRLEVFPIELRCRLPNIAIPLREGEPDIAVDLQDLFDLTYIRGRFEELLDYDHPAEPRLDPDDAAWAAERIATWRAEA